MPRKKQVRQQNIKYDNQNTKYANQNTKYANQKFTLFCREAIFVANLRTFLAYFLQAKKYGGVPKRTNIRYASNGHFVKWCRCLLNAHVGNVKLKKMQIICAH